jgi:hypothetical protein
MKNPIPFPWRVLAASISHRPFDLPAADATPMTYREHRGTARYVTAPCLAFETTRDLVGRPTRVAQYPGSSCPTIPERGTREGCERLVTDESQPAGWSDPA